MIAKGMCAWVTPADIHNSLEANISGAVQDVSDMRAVNKQDGKVQHPAAGQLLPARQAPLWPSMPLSTATSEDGFDLTNLPQGIKARVVFARYRQSAEAYLQGWRNCVVKAFAGDGRQSVDIVELNAVDLTVRHSE